MNTCSPYMFELLQSRKLYAQNTIIMSLYEWGSLSREAICLILNLEMGQAVDRLWLKRTHFLDCFHQMHRSFSLRTSSSRNYCLSNNWSESCRVWRQCHLECLSRFGKLTWERTGKRALFSHLRIFTIKGAFYLFGPAGNPNLWNRFWKVWAKINRFTHVFDKGIGQCVAIQVYQPSERMSEE